MLLEPMRRESSSGMLSPTSKRESGLLSPISRRDSTVGGMLSPGNKDKGTARRRTFSKSIDEGSLFASVWK